MKNLLIQAFDEPNHTQTPNKFFDMVPDMSEAELRVTLVMIRHTLGYHKNTFKMGMQKLGDASGLTRQGAMAGAEAAEKRGIFKRSNPDSQKEAEWELNLLPVNVDDMSSSFTSSVNVDDTKCNPRLQQSSVKESIKKDKEDFSKPVMQGIEASIYQGRPTTQDDIIASQKDVWRGREICPGNYIIYGDWWHAKTGLHMYGAKSKQKVDSEWLSAFKTWYEFEITIPALEEAYKANEWRKVSKPSQITNDAKLAQAAGINKVATPERTTSTGYFA